MEIELPKEIWIHAGVYEGLDGTPICDRRWFVGQINPDDVKYIPAKLDRQRAIATVAKIIADDPTLPDVLAGALMRISGVSGAKPYEVCDE